MRGIVSVRDASAQLDRITPAHAGNSILGVEGIKYNEDHPRPCGE